MPKQGKLTDIKIANFDGQPAQAKHPSCLRRVSQLAIGTTRSNMLWLKGMGVKGMSEEENDCFAGPKDKARKQNADTDIC